MSPSIFLSLIALALAHHPHSVATSAAAEDDSQDLWLVLSRRSCQVSGDCPSNAQLMFSGDGGRHFGYVPGPYMNQEPRVARMRGGELLLLTDEGGLWHTSDGEVWTETALFPGGRAYELLLGEGFGVAATDSGLYVGDLVGDPEGAVLHFEGVAAVAADLMGDTIVAALADRRIVRSDDRGGSWQTVGTVDFTPLALAARDGVVWLGSEARGAARLNLRTGQLTDCEALPDTSGGPYEQAVPLLAARDGDDRLLAASGHQALFVSVDDCESWVFYESGVDIGYDPENSALAPDLSYGFTDLEVLEGKWLMTHWGGISTTRDQGRGWDWTPLIPEDYAQDVRFDPGWPDTYRIWRTGYGGGLSWSDDGGAIWSGSAVGLDEGWGYKMAFLGGDRMIHLPLGFASGYFLSADRGERWSVQYGPAWLTQIRSIGVFGDRSYMGGYEGLAWSEDAGASWTIDESLTSEVRGAYVMELLQTSLLGEGEELVLAAGPPLRVIAGGPDAWRPVFASESGFPAGMMTWPPAAPTRILVMELEKGIWYSDDRGETWGSLPLPSESCWKLVGAPDGTLFLLDRLGYVHRSGDGGETWEAFPTGMDTAVHVLRAAPDFAESGLLLAGTLAGVWWSSDRGETWQRTARGQRLEAETYHIHCDAGAGGLAPGGVAPPDGGEDGCTPYEFDSHGLGGGVLLGPGQSLSFSTLGTSLRILGTWPGDGLVDVWEGEALLASFTPSGDPLVVEGLAEGWKDLRVVHSGGGSVHIDAIETLQPGAPILIPDAPEPLDTADTAAPDSGPGAADTGDGAGGEDSGPVGSGSVDTGPDDSAEPPLPEEAACGCGEGSSAWLLLVLLGIRRRR